MSVNVILPPKARKIVYIVLAIATVLVIPGIGIWYTSAGLAIPLLVVRIGAVASFVAGSGLTLAMLNINKDDPFVNGQNKLVDPDDAPVDEDEPEETDDPDEPEVEAVLTDKDSK